MSRRPGAVRTTSGDAPFRTQLAALVPIGLAALQERADLQTRIDRKYIVPARLAAELLEAGAADLEVLEIDGKRSFRYESVYFDTPGLTSYYGAARSRRRRFKVRTRTYLDSGLCALEVKTTGGRGETIKVRREHPIDARSVLTPEALDFVADVVPEIDPRELRATLTTHYNRATVLSDSGARMTFDTDLTCVGPGGTATRELDEVLIETKAPANATPADRWLWRRGLRPVRVSKYATGLALLTPGLPANKWNRTLRRHFNWPETDR